MIYADRLLENFNACLHEYIGVFLCLCLSWRMGFSLCLYQLMSLESGILCDTFFWAGKLESFCTWDGKETIYTR